MLATTVFNPDLPQIGSRKTVAFHTLGCKLNYSETSALSRQLAAEGFQEKKFEEAADVYIINTCSVTEAADKECRMLVRRIRRRAPEAFVVITGCYAQLKPQEIARIDGVRSYASLSFPFVMPVFSRPLAPSTFAGAPSLLASA